jgi:hypothetical protein
MGHGRKETSTRHKKLSRAQPIWELLLKTLFVFLRFIIVEELDGTV